MTVALTKAEVIASVPVGSPPSATVSTLEF